jgi:signal transduction histidine kinase
MREKAPKTGVVAQHRVKAAEGHLLAGPVDRPRSVGTGLGLSISHDIIVKQHAGAIEVESEPGKFTEFRIILPRSAT